MEILRWPHPFSWAFGITDDCDESTTGIMRTVYEACLARGIRPSRMLWVQPPTRNCGIVQQWRPDPGVTLEDDEYRAYCQSLQERGVELALHGVSSGNNTRDEIFAGFERFKATFGEHPALYSCHAIKADNPYWAGAQSALAKRLIGAVRFYEEHEGEKPDSPYYWTDLCRSVIRYIRLYRTLAINVLAPNPNMPYHQYDKPDVRFWFSTAAQDHHIFARFTDASLDRIAREDGACIVYLHAVYLVQDGRLKPTVESGLDAIARRDDCWKATTTEILDRCLATKNLIVSKRRHAVVISNPTAIAVNRLQVRSSRPLFTSTGEPLGAGRIHAGDLPAQSCMTLYYSKDEAEVGDPAGISAFERRWMLIEEAKRFVWRKWTRKRDRARRRRS